MKLIIQYKHDMSGMWETVAEIENVQGSPGMAKMARGYRMITE